MKKGLKVGSKLVYKSYRNGLKWLRKIENGLKPIQKWSKMVQKWSKIGPKILNLNIKFDIKNNFEVFLGFSKLFVILF